MPKNWTRWVPAIAAPAALIVAGAVVVPMAASAAPNLPEKSPAEVLSLIAASDVDAFSGEVTATSDLGLPSLSSIPGGGPTGTGSETDAASTVLEFLTGSHDLRVYRDGGNSRVQVMDQLAERDVIVSDDEAWLYDSDENSVLHVTDLPSTHAVPETSVTPDQLATQIVDALAASSELTVDTAQRVAGRDAYTLVLEPRTAETLVGDVSIAVDAQTGLPLSVSVTARGADTAAVLVAFTSIDYADPSATLFDFTAPQGAEVTEESLDGVKAPDAAAHGSNDLPTPTVTGEGWASVVAVDAGADLSELTSQPLFTQLATRTDRGYVLQTALVTVLVTDDGRVLAGSVPAATLEAAAE
jgi:outer membrane lipoprotein-sorting protein